MKILLGGLFDPIHNGHLNLALHIHQQFGSKISLLPAGGIPNYKPQPQASITHRINMLEIIAHKYPHALDINYSEAAHAEYLPTYISLSNIRKTIDPNTPLYFVIGSDALINLDSWHNWLELFELTNFIIVMRPDYSLAKMSAQLAHQIMPRVITKSHQHSNHGKIVITDFTSVGISSTLIRECVALKHSISQFVDESVEDYIYEHYLYQKGL